MYCQQHLIALLYAFLASFVNVTESLGLSPDKSLSNQTYELEYCNQALVIFSGLNYSDAEVDELGYAVSLGRRLCWTDPGAIPGRNISIHSRSSEDGVRSVLNLTVTLTIPVGKEASMQLWKRLLTRPHDSPEAIVTLGEIIVLDFRLEHSDPQWERRSKTWNGQPEAASGSDPESASQRREVRTETQTSENTLGFRSGSDGRVHPHDNNDPVRKNSHSRGSVCVDTFCEGFDLKKTCAPEGKTPAKEEICALCYPERNLAVIERLCSKQEVSGRQAFYSVCVLLGCFVVVAVLLYLLRSFCRGVQRRYRIFRGLCSAQTSRSPATKSGSSSVFQVDSLPSLFPGFSSPTKLEVLQRENVTGTDDASDPTLPFFTLKQKWRQLGAFRRDFRGRIQDIFDIESLDTEHAKGGQSAHKIPVLPRAPNASIRRYCRETKSKTPPDFFSGNGAELRNDGSVVSHPTSL
ncbi:uncharacterized protein NFIA_013690 [Aspergillus fischeri NRRL 181]|uniref:Integral membrane protein n=1 Tax=Neosartorya fischeri (strain ATCC 1020 / DSM 3700 / CBS 544.65 / FGSC A1164 / JCM 1740 / NRRL 181 / WB 181) TaxID=331117 RepID=A1D2N7_NEOFI|nr:conserved hypothetical protein [Aspergillus fischeri NRRL 181]EAW22680.1 conserved hypothetical protein [Aspergillus fischeri NRRL 181]KAG2012771.1 hypothetical protein GB937_006857 [Aspergillus fischeri]